MVYRKISPSQAAAKLQDMKANCPNEDVDAFTGHIYMLAGDEKAAYEAYSKADVNKLDRTGLNEFARSSYFTGHFADALKASEAGVKLFPRSPIFNRLAMFSNYELKNYDAAKNYIHRYFNETDSAKFSEYDHYYTALIYNALNDKENAYKQYDKALSAFDKAVKLCDGNELYAPLFILKKATVLHEQGKYADEAAAYQIIKDKYLNFANENRVNVDKYIERANALAANPDAAKNLVAPAAAPAPADTTAAQQPAQ
jgi:tetratricopeptide (TPR) repeat protein